jgi:hypothetical protein
MLAAIDDQRRSPKQDGLDTLMHLKCGMRALF